MSNQTNTDEVADKIRSSALLVSLQLGSYNPVKTDKTESRKVSTSHGINDPKLMKVQKHTLPTAGVLEDISKLDTKIRAQVDKFTAPFARGIGLLPAVKFFDLRKEVNALFDERAVLVKKLADEYTIYLDGSRRSLNGAFKDDDYPPVSDVISRFYAKLDSFAIANPKDARLGVLGEIAEQIQAAQTETLNEKLASVAPYVRASLLKPLCHLSSVLQNPDAKHFDSAFTNILEAAEQAEHLNLLGEDQINNAVFAIRDRLDRTMDQIKSDDHLRKIVLCDCNNIIESLDGTIPPPIESKGTGKAKKAKKTKAPILCDVLPPPPAEIIVPELANDDAWLDHAVAPTTPSSAEVAENEPEIPAEVAEMTKTNASFDADALLAKLGW